MVYSVLSFATVTVVVAMELTLFVEEIVMANHVLPLLFTTTNYTVAALAMAANT
jgi:hypothetical protein